VATPPYISFAFAGVSNYKQAAVAARPDEFRMPPFKKKKKFFFFFIIYQPAIMSKSKANATYLTTNAPCWRLLFVRNPKTEVHVKEAEIGIVAARSAETAAEDSVNITQVGELMLDGFCDRYADFMRGPRSLSPIEFGETTFCVASLGDKTSVKVIEHLNRCSCCVGRAAPIIAQKFDLDLLDIVALADTDTDPDTKTPRAHPIVCFGSADDLNPIVRKLTGIRDDVYLCPPLMSVTMIDYFGPNKPVVVHTVNNTDICGNSWWNNAPPQ
jgi:hypothetical protein